jgi:hypothetical protein
MEKCIKSFGFTLKFWRNKDFKILRKNLKVSFIYKTQSSAVEDSRKQRFSILFYYEIDQMHVI